MDLKAHEDLWASRMLPEGVIERWFARDGDDVEAGQKLVELRIEDALHELVAPSSGRLSIRALVNDVIEPGALLCSIDS